MTPQDQADLEQKVEELTNGGQAYERVDMPHPNLDDLNELLKRAFPKFHYALMSAVDKLEHAAYPDNLQLQTKPLNIPPDEVGNFGPEISTELTEAVARAKMETRSAELRIIPVGPIEVADINEAIREQGEKLLKSIPEDDHTEEAEAQRRMCKQRVRLHGNELVVSAE